MPDTVPTSRPAPAPRISQPSPQGTGAASYDLSLPHRRANRELAVLGEAEIARQAQSILSGPARRRTKLWEFATNLHCSIIGTCLSTSELRQALIKAGLPLAGSASEHDLHASGVLVAGKHRDGAKVLQKALDRRHRLAIGQFDRARAAGEVRALWTDAVREAEIPGAYWASLTHPATTPALLSEIFADVHMLSHLVGAANRADLRRLRALEGEKEALEAKIERQQAQLRTAILARDTEIRELRRALASRPVEVPDEAPSRTGETNPTAWAALVGDLERRLARSELRAERAETARDRTRAALADARAAGLAAAARECCLREEVDALEASLALPAAAEEPPPAAPDLPARTVLYVGGRQSQIGHLRALAERAGATLLYHDGGLQERGSLLAGLVSRADAVLFPVDCVSHDAMATVKRLCRQSGKPYLPLRTAGAASFCAALNRPAIDGRTRIGEADDSPS